MANRTTKLLLVLALLAATGHAHAADGVMRKRYVWKRNDVLSLVLYAEGLGRSRGPKQLYGPGGWLSRNRKANPQIKNWQKIAVGTPVILLLPATLTDRPAPVAEKTRIKTKTTVTTVQAKTSTTATTTNEANPKLLKAVLVHTLAPPPPSRSLPWGVFSAVCGALIALGIFAKMRNFRHEARARAQELAAREWRSMLDNLFACSPDDFEHNTDATLEKSRGSIEPILFDSVLLNSESETKRRARVVYRRLSVVENDRLQLMNQRASDRLAAARRIASLEDPAFTKEIFEAFDGDVKLSVADLHELLRRVVRYDAEGVLAHLPTCAAKPLLRASIRALGEARVTKAEESLTDIRDTFGVDREIAADIGQALHRLAA